MQFVCKPELCCMPFMTEVCVFCELCELYESQRKIVFYFWLFCNSPQNKIMWICLHAFKLIKFLKIRAGGCCSDDKRHHSTMITVIRLLIHTNKELNQAASRQSKNWTHYHISIKSTIQHLVENYSIAKRIISSKRNDFISSLMRAWRMLL